jgi:hypothetical protein
MGGAAESYLIRIYRRDLREPQRVAGVVELIEQERTESFKSVEALMQILGIGSGSSSDGKGKKGKWRSS